MAKSSFWVDGKIWEEASKKYDFVLIIRPDLDYPKIDLTMLEKINTDNVIATHELYPHHKEVLDYFFMGKGFVSTKFSCTRSATKCG